MKKKIVAGALAALMASSLSIGANAACATPQVPAYANTCGYSVCDTSANYCDTSANCNVYSSCLNVQYTCYYSCGGWIVCTPCGTYEVSDPDTSVTPDASETPDASVTPDSGEETEFSEFATEVLELVNAERAAYGLNALTLSEDVCSAAQAKADDMQSLNYFDHTSPTYGGLSNMMAIFGISYRSAGENIAYGYKTPSAVVTAWMNSAGHRANILSANYTQMGIGYTESGNYWCQLFIG